MTSLIPWRLASRTILAVLLLVAAGPVAGSEGVPVGRGAVASAAPTPASDLRMALGRLLGEHAYLLMSAMRADADGAPDASALATGLDANSQALKDAIASVYGDQAGAAFEPIWQRHIDASTAYAKAAKARDATGTRAALDELSAFSKQFAEFLTGANPRISPDSEVHAMQLHIDQLTSFLANDYEQAFATERAAYSHMFDFGDEIARAIVAQFPDRFPDGDVAFSPRTTLRLTLGRLLGEHLVLAAAAMRSGLVQGADSSAAVGSIGQNSADLAEAVGRIFGAEARDAFSDVWSRHIETYLQYIDAVRSGDAAGRQTALESLHRYHVTLAEFLHGAIPNVSEADIEALISHHVTALINQVDAAAAGDQERAVTVTREAYGQMFVVGDALGNGIAQEFPDRFGDVARIPATNTEPENDVAGSCSIHSSSLEAD